MVKIATILFATCILLVFAVNNVHAQTIPAFPGAEGFGSTTIGGRGGAIIKVTNLNDSGAGSFRQAVQNTSGARIVVFDVGGVIQLDSNVTISNPNITIAGQTAPGDGIILKGSAIFIRTSDVIIRGLKMRIGDGAGASPSDRDGITAWGDSTHQINNIIVDHNSIAWAVDENASVYDTTNNQNNITFSWNIISEGLYCSTNPDGCHSMGMLVESPQGKVSIHHNLFASNADRNPAIQSGSVEVANNVIYDWGIHPTKASGGRLNILGNKYIKTSGSSVWIGPGVTGIHCESSPIGIYVNGNVGPVGNDLDTVACTGVLKTQVVNDTTPTFVGSGLTVTSADQAYTDVIADAGAYNRDSVDTRAITHLGNSISNLTWRIDSQTAVGGWPTYNSGTPLQDTDGDAIPDSWETSHGLNPNSSADASSVSQSGYTWIEEYINSYFGDSGPVATPNYNIADINQDGFVNMTDFNQVVANFKLTGALGWIRSDVIQNGIVDIFDFNRVLSNYE